MGKTGKRVALENGKNTAWVLQKIILNRLHLRGRVDRKKRWKKGQNNDEYQKEMVCTRTLWSLGTFDVVGGRVYRAACFGGRRSCTDTGV